MKGIMKGIKKTYNVLVLSARARLLLCAAQMPDFADCRLRRRLRCVGYQTQVRNRLEKYSSQIRVQTFKIF